MQLRNNKILVTGGCGFIGSHLVDALLKQGNKVVVVDNLSAGSLTNLGIEKQKISKKSKKTHLTVGNLTIIVGDICDLELMKSVCKDIDIIFHFAAQPDVRRAYHQLFEDFEVNVRGTLNMLEAARVNNIKHFVFASSAGTIYGEKPQFPTKEEHAFYPISFYGAAKAACEAYISSYSHLFNMKCCVLRYGNIFGERSTHGVMYDFFFKLKKDRERLEILGDGMQQKTYLYIEDCISATLLCVKKQKKQFDAFNISSDELIKVKDIAKIIIDELKLPNVKLYYTGSKRGWPGDVIKAYADITKLRKLGFTPKFTTEEGIRRYIQWLILYFGFI